MTATKAKALRELLTSERLRFLMEAHNGLSAKVAEEAGFEGLWGSGLSISASMGVRDNNEMSWTQVLDLLEFMSDAVSIPLLLDGDTGYGNFNNMRRLVQKLETRGIAGVCIEDKLFPKTNSFIGENQPLADMDEFCGKIKAGKDAQRDDDFAIVARVEALIAGWGLDEALKRAEAYRRAGADAILIHSQAVASRTRSSAFMKEWAGRCPVVIVPTTYYDTPTEAFRAAGVSVVIWANHLMRSVTHRHAADGAADARGGEPAERRGPHRHRQGGLPPPGRGRARGGGEALPAAEGRDPAGRRPGRRPRARSSAS